MNDLSPALSRNSPSVISCTGHTLLENKRGERGVQEQEEESASNNLQFQEFSPGCGVQVLARPATLGALYLGGVKYDHLLLLFVIRVKNLFMSRDCLEVV